MTEETFVTELHVLGSNDSSSAPWTVGFDGDDLYKLVSNLRFSYRFVELNSVTDLPQMKRLEIHLTEPIRPTTTTTTTSTPTPTPTIPTTTTTTPAQATLRHRHVHLLPRRLGNNQLVFKLHTIAVHGNAFFCLYELSKPFIQRLLVGRAIPGRLHREFLLEIIACHGGRVAVHTPHLDTNQIKDLFVYCGGTSHVILEKDLEAFRDTWHERPPTLIANMKLHMTYEGSAITGGGALHSLRLVYEHADVPNTCPSSLEERLSRLRSRPSPPPPPPQDFYPFRRRPSPPPPPQDFHPFRCLHQFYIDSHCLVTPTWHATLSTNSTAPSVRKLLFPEPGNVRESGRTPSLFALRQEMDSGRSPGGVSLQATQTDPIHSSPGFTPGSPGYTAGSPLYSDSEHEDEGNEEEEDNEDHHHHDHDDDDDDDEDSAWYAPPPIAESSSSASLPPIPDGSLPPILTPEQQAAQLTQINREVQSLLDASYRTRRRRLLHLTQENTWLSRAILDAFQAHLDELHAQTNARLSREDNFGAVDVVFGGGGDHDGLQQALQQSHLITAQEKELDQNREQKKRHEQLLEWMELRSEKRQKIETTKDKETTATTAAASSTLPKPDDGDDEFLDDGLHFGAVEEHTETKDCVICTVELAGTLRAVFMPCRHAVTHKSCGYMTYVKTGVCPVCRKKIKNVGPLYL